MIPLLDVGVWDTDHPLVFELVAGDGMIRVVLYEKEVNVLVRLLVPLLVEDSDEDLVEFEYVLLVVVRGVPNGPVSLGLGGVLYGPVVVIL